MSAATALDVQQDGNVVTEDRAGFAALRAELHSRNQDEDLAALWAELATGERRAVLASAKLDPSESMNPLELQPRYNRQAIRAAIHRMSQYAGRLKDRLTGGQSAAAGMAANAAAALAAGDREEVMHWLKMIQKEAN